MSCLSQAELEARVIHEAEGLLVVDKPPGLPTSGRDLEDANCLQWHLMRRLGRMVWAVHQLDADTSGLNVFVTRKSLVAVCAQRLRFPEGRKFYIAICHGEPEFDTLLVQEPIGELGPRRLGVTPLGKPCQSVLTSLSRARGYGLVGVELRTGRTHQARIHLAYLGHPLVGEPFYREPPCELMPRHALHAARLELGGEDSLVLSAELPRDLRIFCEKMGLEPEVRSLTGEGTP